MKKPQLPPHAHNAARTAAKWMEDYHGSPRVVDQLASGSAVYFGDQALFIPGKDPLTLARLVERRTEELACAYLAYLKALDGRK